MPIAAIGDGYSEEHWRRVKKIISRAINVANMRVQLVWENPEVDVIQSAILQNLYENDVVICDVSGLNPNVMLEAGLRLSTKRPTIIVTDRAEKPPFDISTIGYIEYQRDLEFNAIDDFIERLSKKIIQVSKAADDGTYQSFVQHYKFETVTPATINVSAEQYIKDRLDDINRSIERLDRVRTTAPVKTTTTATRQKSPWKSLKTYMLYTDWDSARAIETEIDELEHIICHLDQVGSEEYTCAVRYKSDEAVNLEKAISTAENIIKTWAGRYAAML